MTRQNTTADDDQIIKEAESHQTAVPLIGDLLEIIDRLDVELTNALEQNKNNG